MSTIFLTSPAYRRNTTCPSGPCSIDPVLLMTTPDRSVIITARTLLCCASREIVASTSGGAEGGGTGIAVVSEGAAPLGTVIAPEEGGELEEATADASACDARSARNLPRDGAELTMVETWGFVACSAVLVVARIREFRKSEGQVIQVVQYTVHVTIDHGSPPGPFPFGSDFRVFGAFFATPSCYSDARREVMEER